MRLIRSNWYADTQSSLKIMLCMLMIALISAVLCVSQMPSGQVSNFSKLYKVEFESLPALLSDNPQLVILDVRTKREFLDFHLPGAINIPAYDFNKKFMEIPRTSKILVFSFDFFRSSQVSRKLLYLRPDIGIIYFSSGMITKNFKKGWQYSISNAQLSSD